MDDATSGWRMKSLSIKIILLNFPPNSHMRKDEQPRNGWFAKKKSFLRNLKLTFGLSCRYWWFFRLFFAKTIVNWAKSSHWSVHLDPTAQEREDETTTVPQILCGPSVHLNKLLFKFGTPCKNIIIRNNYCHSEHADIKTDGHSNL